MENHCDGVADCENNFDELNCSMLLMDQNLYRKEYPPLQMNRKGTIIKISFSILSFGNFEEIDMKFTVKFLILLEW